MPSLPTVGPYPTGLVLIRWRKISSFGLFEQGHLLFFYQIDYFGDVFVLEWSEQEWIQFVVNGDQFEVW